MSNDSPFLSSDFRGAFEQGAMPPTALMQLLGSQLLVEDCCWFGHFPRVDVCNSVGVKQVVVGKKDTGVLTQPSLGI